MAEYIQYHDADSEYQQFINDLADNDPTNSTTDTKRKLLTEAAVAAGNANQAAGAVLRPEVDKAKFGGKAAHFAEKYDTQGITKIREACARCALAEMCPRTPEELMAKLRSSDHRIRFSNRLKRDTMRAEQDNLLCDDYLDLSRIKNRDRKSPDENSA